MRKITVLSFISLDGVMQGPGSPEEDVSNDFKLGGWVAAYDDQDSHAIMQKQLEQADLLLGRKTFDIWESYWPTHAAYRPGINEVTKYVLSNTVDSTEWTNVVFLKDLEGIKKLKLQRVQTLRSGGAANLFSSCLCTI
jgi:dihydrofolate reductase